MKIHFLKQADLPARPSDIVEVENWGMITIMTGGRKAVLGEHVLWEGTDEAFDRWIDALIKSKAEIWLGKNIPQAQEFELYQYGQVA
jgi:hypothetical protein